MASSSLGGTRWRITEEHHITVTGGFKKNKMLLYSQNDDSSSDSITLFQMLVDTNVYRSRDELTLAWCEELKCSCLRLSFVTTPFVRFVLTTQKIHLIPRRILISTSNES